MSQLVCSMLQGKNLCKRCYNEHVIRKSLLYIPWIKKIKSSPLSMETIKNQRFMSFPAAHIQYCLALSQSLFWASHFPLKQKTCTGLFDVMCKQYSHDQKETFFDRKILVTSWSLVFSFFSFTRYSIFCLWFLCPTSFPFSSDSWTFCLRRTSFSCKIENISPLHCTTAQLIN